MKKEERKIDVKVVKGSILNVNARGLVVPQFTYDMSLAGVSGGVARSGHYRAVFDYGIAARQMRMPFGYALVTNGVEDTKIINVSVLGNCKEKSAFDIVQLATFSALTIAEQNGVSEIAIPALGTGRSGTLSFEQSAQAMLSALETFRCLKSNGLLKKVMICIAKSNKSYTAYWRIAQNRRNYEAYVNDELVVWNDSNHKTLMKH